MNREDEIEIIWRHYLQYHPRLPMAPPRAEAKRIGLMLDDGYSVDLICDAIDGMSVDDWYRSKNIHRLRCMYHLQAGDDVDRIEQFAQQWEQHEQKKAIGEARRKANERNQEYARRERLEAIAAAKRKAANERPDHVPPAEPARAAHAGIQDANDSVDHVRTRTLRDGKG